MEEEEKEKWVEGVKDAIAEASAMVAKAITCPCGCDAPITAEYGRMVIVPTLRKAITDYMEVRKMLIEVGRMQEEMGREEGEKDEGTTDGIPASILN